MDDGHRNRYGGVAGVRAKFEQRISQPTSSKFHILYVKIETKMSKIVNIFLSISLNIRFGCSKEPSHRDGSFEYPQHMFWLRNKKINF